MSIARNMSETNPRIREILFVSNFNTSDLSTDWKFGSDSSSVPIYW